MTSRRRFLRDSSLTAAAWLAHSALAQNPAPQPATPQAAPPGQTAPPAQNAPASPGVQPEPNLIQTLQTTASGETIRQTKLTDTVYLLQGVGGNIVCQFGPDGQLLIDSGIDTGSPHLLDALRKLSPQSLRFLVNTHWHFDHTSGNAAVHLAGALIVAQANTRIRLSSAQYMAVYDLHVPAAPDAALPQDTFPDTATLWLNNDQLDLVHTPYAHTDSDIFIHFNKANVIHTGDLWFNGMYPLIDTSSGGTINGMIHGVDQVLSLADDRTQIVPGHGPLGNKAALVTYREMLVTVANRVEKLKAQGSTVQQAVDAEPTADLDAAWAKPGALLPSTFVALVYNTL